jgi:hypothetical protein
MKGKKSYNIRNIEAHLNNFSSSSLEPLNISTPNPTPIPLANPNFLLNKKMIFQNNAQNNIINLTNQSQKPDQTQNDYINAKYGVSKYASNLVSGKMFKKI